MRVARPSLLIVVALVACAPPAARDQPAWPELGGPFEVGRLEMDATDASRDETFTDDPTDKRRLLVSVYYPATVPAGARHSPYGTASLTGVAPFFAGRRRDAWLSPSQRVHDGRPVFGLAGGTARRTNGRRRSVGRIR